MYSLTFHVRRYVVMCTDCQYTHGAVVIATKPRALIANRRNNAQQGGTPTIPLVTSGSVQ